MGDLGGPSESHVGDEAMFQSNLEALRALSPGAALVAFSSDPEWTRRRYAVEAMPPPPPIDTPPDASWDVDRDLRQRTGWLIGDSWVSAVESADAVLISGGGNLCSTWPHKIVERTGLIHCARDLGKPVIVVGQTLGPQLSEREREFLGAALVRVDLLGVRELPSCELALGLGVSQDRLRLQFDDAFFLAGVDGGVWREALGGLDKPWILVTWMPRGAVRSIASV